MSEHHCVGCGKSAYPCFTLANSGRMVVECRFCQRQETTLGPQDFNRGVAAMSGADSSGPGWGGKTEVVQSSERPAAALPPTTNVARDARSPMAHGDVLEWIAERVMWLSSEEGRLQELIAAHKASLAGLRAEQRRLARMLSAARTEGRRLRPSARSESPQSPVERALANELKN